MHRQNLSEDGRGDVRHYDHFRVLVCEQPRVEDSSTAHLWPVHRNLRHAQLCLRSHDFPCSHLHAAVVAQTAQACFRQGEGKVDAGWHRGCEPTRRSNPGNKNWWKDSNGVEHGHKYRIEREKGCLRPVQHVSLLGLACRRWGGGTIETKPSS